LTGGRGANGNEGYGVFSTLTGGTMTERMRIDSSGQVGIGLTNPSTRLEVVGASNSTATFIKAQGAIPNNNDNAGTYILHQGTTGAALRVRTDNAVSASQFAHILVNNTSANCTALLVDQYGTADIVAFNKSGTNSLVVDNSSNLKFNSGYGSAATAYGCRAWVNFNGTGTIAIRGSGNISSIGDNAAGNYTINFATAMPDANYSVAALGSDRPGNDYGGLIAINNSNFLAGSVRIYSAIAYSIGLFDPDVVCIQIFR
jgi:hypothetical protein